MDFDDARRLRALRSYRVLDTEPELAFDNVTEIAARLFQAPIVLVSMVDEHRQWFKSKVGLEVSETPREYAFCDHAIRQDEPMVVPDASKDPRFAANPLVTGEPNIRFYCGVPLRTPEGEGLGTLCIIDRKPRSMDGDSLEGLQALARQVEEELEVRKRLAGLEDVLALEKERQRDKELLASMIVHDMRGPLTSILTCAAMLRPDDREQRELVDDLGAEASRMRRMLTDVLDICLSEIGGLPVRKLRFSLQQLATSAEKTYRHVARQRGQTIVLDLASAPLLVDADPDLLQRVVGNLLNNAVRHGPPRMPITLRMRRVGDQIRIEVVDRGAVLPADVQENLFALFQRGGGAAQGGRGIGLAFCARVADALGGSVGVEPDGEQGNRFYFALPATNGSGASS